MCVERERERGVEVCCAVLCCAVFVCVCGFFLMYTLLSIKWLFLGVREKKVANCEKGIT